MAETNDKQGSRPPREVRWDAVAAVAHLTLVNICYCSTPGECWMYSDKHAVGYKSLAQLVTPVDQCPKLPDNVIFNN